MTMLGLGITLEVIAALGFLIYFLSKKKSKKAPFTLAFLALIGAIMISLGYTSPV